MGPATIANQQVTIRNDVGSTRQYQIRLPGHASTNNEYRRNHKTFEKIH